MRNRFHDQLMDGFVLFVIHFALQFSFSEVQQPTWYKRVLSEVQQPTCYKYVAYT